MSAPRPTLSFAIAATGLLFAAALVGAWIFEFVVGLPPCPLCLRQRWPYYAVIPLAGVLVIALARTGPTVPIRLGALVLLGLTLVSVGLGVHHAGVEWGWWAGPGDCAVAQPVGRNAGDLLSTMARTRVVACEEAAWRLFGISLAGWNAAVSLAGAGMIGWALARREPTTS